MGKLVMLHLPRLVDSRALILTATVLALLLMRPFSGSQAEAVVTNPGFESNSLFAWTTGATQEGVFVVGTDVINAAEGVFQTPFEGNFMARLGNTQPSAAETQPLGPNELIQDFIIAGPSVRLAYNIWTYDVTGFDSFSVELLLVIPNEVIYTLSEQAWSSSPQDTSRKSTGWRVLNIPVSTQQQGQLARLTIRSGGTVDNRNAFWAYIDSAAAALPPTLVDTSELEVNGYHPSIDQASGNVHITALPGSPPIHIEAPVLCPEGGTPDPVTAILATRPPLTVVPLLRGINNLWEGDIPIPSEADTGASWPLAFLLLCDGVTVPATVGTVTFVEPSGRVTDAQTGASIRGATVTLQRLDGSTWVTANPFALLAGSPSVNPQVNPQLTGGDGRFGWNVAAGSYRVIATAAGYLGQISAPATAPPLSDLNVALVPLSATQAWDVDCDGDVDAVDSLKLLRHIVGLSVSQTDPCPEIGSPGAAVFGDVDCDGDVDAVDSLKMLRNIVGLLLILPPGCPPLN